MALFDDLAQAALWPALAAVFGEPVVVRQGAIERTVTAIVTRNPPQLLAGIPNERAIAHQLVIRFENHPDRGVASGSLDTGKDTVDMAVHQGGPTSRLRLAELLKDGGGITRVGVV